MMFARKALLAVSAGVALISNEIQEAEAFGRISICCWKCGDENKGQVKKNPSSGSKNHIRSSLPGSQGPNSSSVKKSFLKKNSIQAAQHTPTQARTPSQQTQQASGRKGESNSGPQATGVESPNTSITQDKTPAVLNVKSPQQPVDLVQPAWKELANSDESTQQAPGGENEVTQIAKEEGILEKQPFHPQVQEIAAQQEEIQLVEDVNKPQLRNGKKHFKVQEPQPEPQAQPKAQISKSPMKQITMNQWRSMRKEKFQLAGKVRNAKAAHAAAWKSALNKITEGKRGYTKKEKTEISARVNEDSTVKSKKELFNSAKTDLIVFQKKLNQYVLNNKWDLMEKGLLTCEQLNKIMQYQS